MTTRCLTCWIGGLATALAAESLLLPALAGPPAANLPKTWPRPYAVERNEASGILALRTPYYAIEHDLKRGGAISRIALTHGKAANLLVRPMETRVRDERGVAFSDLNDAAASVSCRREGGSELVTVVGELKSPDGKASGLRVKTTLQYRWGYVRIRKEFTAPGGTRVKEVCPLATVLAPSLTDYGYREGKTEDEGAGAFAFGSNVWGKLRPGHPSDRPLKTPYVPRSMIFADPGVEGLEWFVGSDLGPWEKGPAGRRGQGQYLLQVNADPAGLALAVSTLWSPETALAVPEAFALEFSLSVPIRDGRAQRPWLHTTFNRNRGAWVSTEEIRRWADRGIQTTHCHNDGDYYGDGLFWRDGAYPPYPDMDRYDKVLNDCRQVGIRTATYFSNKELHPSTAEFQKHGQQWGRKDRKGKLQHNFYRPGAEYGAQMCLRSGWLEFLKFSIDRVLKNHPLSGVYYDWNVALLCCNPLHEGKTAAERADGHWDMDELIDLMEWTRNRVGPEGLVIVHNTTVPMFATENFADYVVATEWGYGKWKDRAPALADLPLEWSLVGAVPRGVISYGVLDADSPRRLHRLFAVYAALGGVSPWPVSNEMLELTALLKPLGEIESYRFADWRNAAVHLSDPRCASAVYSRPGEAFLLLANLDPTPREVACALRPDKLPCPLARPVAAERIGLSTGGGTPTVSSASASGLDLRKLLGDGEKILLPGDGVALIRVR